MGLKYLSGLFLEWQLELFIEQGSSDTNLTGFFLCFESAIEKQLGFFDHELLLIMLNLL